MPPPTPPVAATDALSGARLLAYGALAVLILLPVTLPVPVLRGLVSARYECGDGASALFMSINMVGAMFAAPLAGLVADRIGRRRPIVVLALLTDAALFLAMLHAPTLAWFLAARFAEGAAHIAALSLVMGLVADGVVPARRGRAMGMLGAGITLGVALGAPIGGVVGKVDAARVLELGAWISLVAAPCAWLALVEVGGGRARPGLGDIAGLVAREPAIGIPLAYSFIDRFTVGFYTTTFSLYLKAIHALPPDRIGFLLAAFMLPFALLSYPFGRLVERIGRIVPIALGSALYGALTMGVGYTDPDLLAPLMVALGVCSAVMFVPALVMATDLAPAAARTTALGAFNAAGSLGFIVGPLVAAAVSGAVAGQHGALAGYRAAFAVAGAAELACVVATLPFMVALARAGRTR